MVVEKKKNYGWVICLALVTAVSIILLTYDLLLLMKFDSDKKLFVFVFLVSLFVCAISLGLVESFIENDVQGSVFYGDFKNYQLVCSLICMFALFPRLVKFLPFIFNMLEKFFEM